ncbi:MAG: flagellar hook protein FlgE [Campylobacterota bacterium]|nr:flagellar hook protein FlgE [Campylobacterota bacterium]
MVKSLYSGISGLSSHQVAMDVESNNIANVNTTGYKYSRANFSDLLAQTKSIATAPEGGLGGKNAVQVGLGTSVSSTTRIFSQGSIQSTDKNTDLAIQGDGFFILSSDAGVTQKYSRAGDFQFDADGNFVDANGFIVQGWTRDLESGDIDANGPISDISIAPGLTTPANPTDEIILKANLNSGPLVTSFAPSYEVPSGTPADPQKAAVDENGLPVKSGNIGVLFNERGEAFSLQKDQGVWISFQNSLKTDGGAVAAGAAELDITLTLDDGSEFQITTTGGKDTNTVSANAARYVAAINAQRSTTGVTASYDLINNKIDLKNTNGGVSSSHNIRLTTVAGGSGLVAGDVVTAYSYQYDPASSAKTLNGSKTFTTMADLREAMEIQARDPDGNGTNNGIEITVSKDGKFAIKNSGVSEEDYDIDLKVTSFRALGITENSNFTESMSSLNTSLEKGSNGIGYSQSFNAATHSSSIDVFDSLGSKHTVKMDFRKTELDLEVGSTWDMKVSVPLPSTVNTVVPLNERAGSVSFKNDGSLFNFDPATISFSANNGSSPDQQISLEFGSSGQFDGMTSFDSKSSTSQITQDGYQGGDLIGVRVDQSGTIVGSFSNGKSFGLAQVGMAKFTNNGGLAGEGGSVYIQTSNSGNPIIGTAATSGRGFIQSAALEASNVDLSKSLTQLIIVQRGFQANGKTITTSDQLLETLIGLKR